MKIIRNETLAEAGNTKITKLEVIAPDIALKIKPGQFVVVMVSEEGERIPLTVVAQDIGKGTITLIFQEVGLTTKLLGKMVVGDSLYVLVGPLGHPTEIKNYGKVILVGGGVGIAEIHPVAKVLKDAGNHITAILGAKNKAMLILERELKESCDELYISTDDGSYGRKGFVTDVLKELLSHNLRSMAYNLIYAVGPIPMMKKVAEVSRDFNTKTIVSLNALMVDATGMCGCCRVTVSGKTKFSCIDGPEFDGHEVNWDELEKRDKTYIAQQSHICKIMGLD
jgi:ferredoxin--NADP+ reductase